MKCKCGNEQGKPRVKPFPVTFIDVKTKQPMELMYNGSMNVHDGQTQCWFCAVNSLLGYNGKS